MHLGLEEYISIPYLLYLGAIAALLLSIFWRPIVGLYYLLPLIPLQTIRDGLIDYPFGQSVVDILLLGVVVGLMRRGEKVFSKTPLNLLLAVYFVYSFISLFFGSWYLNVSLPLSASDPRLADWKCYFTMPFLLFLAMATVRNTRQMQVFIILMVVSGLALDRNFWGTIADRDLTEYSDDLRSEGAMGYAGANGLAAFEAQFATMLLALAAFERKRIFRYAYLGVAAFTVICLMYSFSRGGYAAFLAGILFVGISKSRWLLVTLAVCAVLWASILPNSVRHRVTMTHKEDGQLEMSSQTRVTLWNDALQIVQSNPLFGTGFNTYAYMGRVGSYRDTHNIYLKVLVETGVIGVLFFLMLLGGLFRLGWKLFREGSDPFLRSLGLALAAWLVCTTVANLFGDRWTYLQVNGYLWILAGCVCRGLAMQVSASEEFLQPTEISERELMHADAEMITS